MFRLAHLSDPHLGPLPPVRPWDLASKRVLGYANWHLHRSRRILQAGSIDAIVNDLKSVAPDHVAVTGDLVNLALTAEFPRAADWLAGLGAPRDVSVVPGNHDAYVPGALLRMMSTCAPFMTGDGASAAGFPYVRRRGEVALVGVSTARATAPFMATGHVDAAQAAALEQVLDDLSREGLCRIVMIHHPPVDGMTPAYKRLVDTARIQTVIARTGAELILHGHTHRESLNWIAGRDRPAPVLGVQAASLQPTPERRGASWNLIEIDHAPGGWQISTTARGLAARGNAVEVLSRQILAPRP